MNASELIRRLSLNVGVLEGLAHGLPDDQVRWKPSVNAWSILDVVSHLLDEEQDDFRTRLDLLLHHPGQAWPGIDPEGWVEAREYSKRDLGKTLELFAEQRKASVAWLSKLGPVEWERSYDHPGLGRMTAGDLLASWVAHDFLHIRQLSRLHWQYTRQLAAPYSVDYAGAW